MHPTGRPCAVRLDEGGPAQKTLKDNDVRLSAVSHMTTMARCAALPPHGLCPPGRAFLA